MKSPRNILQSRCKERIFTKCHSSEVQVKQLRCEHANKRSENLNMKYNVLYAQLLFLPIWEECGFSPLPLLLLSFAAISGGEERATSLSKPNNKGTKPFLLCGDFTT